MNGVKKNYFFIFRKKELSIIDSLHSIYKFGQSWTSCPGGR